MLPTLKYTAKDDGHCFEGYETFVAIFFSYVSIALRKHDYHIVLS